LLTMPSFRNDDDDEWSADVAPIIADDEFAGIGVSTSNPKTSLVRTRPHSAPRGHRFLSHHYIPLENPGTEQ
jgi:hypothetical protein